MSCYWIVSVSLFIWIREGEGQKKVRGEHLFHY